MKLWGKSGVCTVCMMRVPSHQMAEHWGAHFNMRKCADCSSMVFVPK